MSNPSTEEVLPRTRDSVAITSRVFIGPVLVRANAEAKQGL